MGAVATWDYPTFVARYPEFSTISPLLAALYFNEATLYLTNDGSGPVQDAGQQLMLLNMLVAHIVAMNATVNGVAPSGLVGPITSAGQGSVSVSTGLSVPPGSAQWYASTKYGFAFWNATAVYRTMRYRHGPVKSFNPYTPTAYPRGYVPWLR